MRINLLICTTLASGIGLTATATDYPPITFQLTDGTVKTMSSENMSMTFQDGNLIATNSDGTFQTPVSQLSKFYFDLGTEDIQTVGEDPDFDSDFEVFSTTGEYLGNFDSYDNARVSLSPGVYILRSGNKSIKTVVK